MSIAMSIWEKKKEKKKSPRYQVDDYPGNSTLVKWALGEFSIWCLHFYYDQINNECIHSYSQVYHLLIRIQRCSTTEDTLSSGDTLSRVDSTIHFVRQPTRSLNYLSTRTRRLMSHTDRGYVQWYSGSALGQHHISHEWLVSKCWYDDQ